MPWCLVVCKPMNGFVRSTARRNLAGMWPWRPMHLFCTWRRKLLVVSAPAFIHTRCVDIQYFADTSDVRTYGCPDASKARQNSPSLTLSWGILQPLRRQCVSLSTRYSFKHQGPLQTECLMLRTAELPTAKPLSSLECAKLAPRLRPTLQNEPVISSYTVADSTAHLRKIFQMQGHVLGICCHNSSGHLCLFLKPQFYLSITLVACAAIFVLVEE